MRQREAEIWGLASAPGAVALALKQSITVQPVQVFEMKQSPSGSWNARPKPGMSDIAYGAFPLQPPGGKRDRLTPGNLHELSGSAELTLFVPPAHEGDVRKALRAWLAFGGIGGRTRRGFGAVSAAQPEDPNAIVTALYQESGIPGVPLLAPRFARSADTFGTPRKAMEWALGTLKTFRQGVGVGRNPGATKNRPGRSRWPEPDEIRRLTKQTDPKHSTPLSTVARFPRAAFGMPIIFHFKDRNDPGDATLKPRAGERLASPLIIRPYKDGRRFRALAVQLVDPAGSPPAELRWGKETRNVRSDLTREQAERIRPLEGSADPVLRFLQFFTKS